MARLNGWSQSLLDTVSGFLQGKGGWFVYVFVRGGNCALTSAVAKVTVRAGDGASFAVNDRVQVGTDVTQTAQITSIGTGTGPGGTDELNLSGVVSATVGQRILNLGTVAPVGTVYNPNGSTNATSKTTVYIEDSDQATVQPNSKLTTDSEGNFKFFGADALYDALAQDSAGVNKVILMPISVGSASGLYVRRDGSTSITNASGPQTIDNGQLRSDVADGASAVGFDLRLKNTLANAGAKRLRLYGEPGGASFLEQDVDDKIQVIGGWYNTRIVGSRRYPTIKDALTGISSGEAIYLPARASVYPITGADGMQAVPTGIALLGDSPETSIIQMASGANLSALFSLATSNNVQFRNLQLDMNQAANGAGNNRGIEHTTGTITGVSVRNVTFKNSRGSAFHATILNKLRLQQCQFESCGAAANPPIYLSGAGLGVAQEVLIESPYFSTCVGAIGLVDAERFQISGVVLKTPSGTEPLFNLDAACEQIAFTGGTVSQSAAALVMAVEPTVVGLAVDGMVIKRAADAICFDLGVAGAAGPTLVALKGLVVDSTSAANSNVIRFINPRALVISGCSMRVQQANECVRGLASDVAGDHSSNIHGNIFVNLAVGTAEAVSISAASAGADQHNVFGNTAVDFDASPFGTIAGATVNGDNRIA